MTEPQSRTDELVRPGGEPPFTLTEAQLRDMVERAPTNTLYVTDNFGENVIDIVGYVTDVTYRDDAVWVTWTPLKGKDTEGLVLALNARRHADGQVDMLAPGLVLPEKKIQGPEPVRRTPVRKRAFVCLDCPEKGHTSKSGRCVDPTLESYMVTDEVWREATQPDGHRGYLHLHCLELRLKRRLVPADFKKALPINAIIFWAFDCLDAYRKIQPPAETPAR